MTPPHSPNRRRANSLVDRDQDDEVDDDASENSFYIRTSSKADREQTLSAIGVDKSLRQARDEFDRVRNARSRRLGFDDKGDD